MSHIERLSVPLTVSMSDEWFHMNSEDHFWMQARFEEIKPLLPAGLKGSRIFEVGCGNGVFRSQLEQFSGAAVDGCDLNLEALQMAKQGLGRLLVYNIFDRNPSLVGKYDFVFLMDVLEHIKDDQEFLETASAYLKPGGAIVLNVPSGPWLYSLYDKLVGHHRRYTEKQLRDMFLQLSFEISTIRSWGITLIPLAFARKILLPLINSDRSRVRVGFRMPSSILNRVFLWLLRLERLFPVLRFMGTSVIVVATKPI